MPLDVKICGLTTPDALAAALDGGARWVGFVFFARSPRHLDPGRAAGLVGSVPDRVGRVGLFVDADDAFIDRVLAATDLDLLQFHGAEPPDRVAAARARFGRPVMKALPIAGPADVAAARAWDGVADRLLFDARPPKDATRPGGNAAVFDWTLLAGTTWKRPWMLAGGLDAGNLALAVRTSGARAVDVSSGVEDAPGVKSPDKIRAFLAAAAAL